MTESNTSDWNDLAKMWQADAAWARRLAAFANIGRVALWLLTALLGIGLVAVTFNTIRLQILTQRAEIMGAYLRRELREYLGIIRDVIAEGQTRGVFRRGVNPTFAAKVNANFPGNPDRGGLPTIQGVIRRRILVNHRVDAPVAVTEGPASLRAAKLAATVCIGRRPLVRALQRHHASRSIVANDDRFGSDHHPVRRWRDLDACDVAADEAGTQVRVLDGRRQQLGDRGSRQLRAVLVQMTADPPRAPGGRGRRREQLGCRREQLGCRARGRRKRERGGRRIRSDPNNPPPAPRSRCPARGRTTPSDRARTRRPVAFPRETPAARRR